MIRSLKKISYCVGPRKKIKKFAQKNEESGHKARKTAMEKAATKEKNKSELAV